MANSVVPTSATKDWLDAVKWDADGLVPVIAQDVFTNRVLMFAWMNKEALALTNQTRKAVYFSRSRAKLWFKGEESGNEQIVRDIRIDCDADVVLLKIQQSGAIACHTGRHSCFYSSLQNDQWLTQDPVLQDPATMYKAIAKTN